DERVKKILRAKYWCGLNKRQSISLKNLNEDLNTNEAKLLKQQLVENALTLVRNKNNFIPLKKLDTLRIASVAIGAFSRNQFQEMLEQYAPVKSFQMDKQASKEDYAALATKLKDYNLVIVSIHNMNKKSSDFYGITQSAETFIDAISQQKKTIVTIFGSPYALKFFEDKNWLLECYNDEEITQKMAAQLLFGGIKAKGKLSVSASKTILSGTGLLTTSTIRLKYSQAEEVGVREDLLKKIDSIVDDALLDRAFPGCQVLVAKDGIVIYQKSFGYLTYDKIDSVRNDDLYDLASVTKIAATNIEIMKLYDEGKIDLNKTLGDYLPETVGTNKSSIMLKELLTHTAGLKPFIPFYKHTLDASGRLDENLYSSISTKDKNIRVTKDIFMKPEYIDTMWQDIISSPVSTRGTYVYSDLDFYFLKAVAEKITGKPINELVDKNFYSPLGSPTMGYNPTDKFSLDRIVPSNYDNFYRHELIRGFVHDQGAAMLGGVGGHAGVFSSANDLAIEMQMLLNKGEYGGEKYFSPETVQKFTTQAGKICRRGLGFDKPEPDPDRASPCCSEASCNTYGHQGFTGTCVWTDPQYNLIFVFLSNRTFPDDENGKINSLNVRKNIQEAIYKAILNSND
ncbi:MAG: serine hydrolase, partial [Bacteroidota bacterium]